MRDPTATKELPAPCSEFEGLILDYFDGTLSDSESRKVEGHVRSCRSCETFWKEQQQLDLLLAATIKPLSLPSDFKNRILQQAFSARAQTARGSSTDPNREFETLVERLRGNLRRRVGFALLDLMGGAAVALVIGLAIQQLLARASALAMTLPQGIHLYAAWGSAAVCLSFGVWVGLAGRMRSPAFWR